jgi:hypothetical protein
MTPWYGEERKALDAKLKMKYEHSDKIVTFCLIYSRSYKPTSSNPFDHALAIGRASPHVERAELYYALLEGAITR